MRSEFKQIGIYEKGDVITVKNVKRAMLDCTFDFALIREIKGEPVGPLTSTCMVYDGEDVDFEICNISKLDTWKKIVETSLLEGVDWGDKNPLEFVLTISFKIDDEVFDYLYSVFPDTKLESILYKIQRYNAAVWAHKHGADPYYKGFKTPMEEWLRHNKYKDSKKIYEYLYSKKTKQDS